MSFALLIIHLVPRVRRRNERPCSRLSSLIPLSLSLSLSLPLVRSSTHMALLHPFLPRARLLLESQERLLIARSRVNYRVLHEISSRARAIFSELTSRCTAALAPGIARENI